MKFKDEISGHEYSLEQYIQTQLEQPYNEAGSGALEQAQRKADNCAEAIVNLVSVLVNKQMLTKDEIIQIFGDL